ncbi:hypothetical protein MN608_02854 [Microdochium nivale]|nr:hypothetical protein MN608_02854 [Microdochium nivale]
MNNSPSPAARAHASRTPKQPVPQPPPPHQSPSSRDPGQGLFLHWGKLGLSRLLPLLSNSTKCLVLGLEFCFILTSTLLPDIGVIHRFNDMARFYPDGIL